MDCHVLNDGTLPLHGALPDIPELQWELGSKAAKWYTTTDITNPFFSIHLTAECRPQCVFTWRVSNTSGINCSKGRNIGLPVLMDRSRLDSKKVRLMKTCNT